MVAVIIILSIMVLALGRALYVVSSTDKEDIEILRELLAEQQDLKNQYKAKVFEIGCHTLI